MATKSTRFIIYLLSSYRNYALTLTFLALGMLSVNGQAYCPSSASSQFDTDVDFVSFNTISNNTAGICAQYSNFTNLSTTVTTNNVYNLSVTAGTCGGNFTKCGKVWIDYNQDFDFFDAGEEVFAFGPTSTTQTFNTTVTIPPSATPGTTRMRVVVFETSSPANIDPCVAYTWGETEDYSVLILPAAANDMGVTAITTPNSGCNLGLETVNITVMNFGTSVQNAWTVSYNLNNGPIITTDPMTGPLAGSGGTMPHTMSIPVNIPVNTNILKAWVNLPGDAFPVNDTFTKVVTHIPGIFAYPYVEDFEANNGGWLPGGTNSSWAYGTPNKTVIIGAASGVNAYVTGGLTGDYNNNEDSYLLGPCFDLSVLQNPWISFDIWWHSETIWDGTNLQYSTDFGTTWLNVGAFGDPGNWYNYNSIISTPGNSGDGWTGTNFGQPPSSGGWVTAAHRLDGLAGAPSVRFRFTFGSDGSVIDDGIAIDNVRIAEGPVADLGPDQLLCGGDSIVLDAGNFAGFQWSTGSNTQLDTITQNGTGAIWVKITDSFGFYDFDTVLVTLSNPQVEIGQDSSICPGDTVVLDAGPHPGGTISWDNGAGTGQFYPATTAGLHHVFVTDSVGCTKRDSMMVTILIPPTLALGNDTTVCVGSPVTLNGGPGPVGTVYQWNNGANTQVVIVASPGIYSASVTTPGGCSAIDTMEVFNHPSPGVSLGPDRVECGPFTLDAGPGGTSYIWNTGDQTQMISANAAGAYRVTITNSFGCQRSDTVMITMSSPPSVNLGPNQVLCNGATLTLDAGNTGMSYLWSYNNLTTQSITVNTPGTYYVTVTNPQGCEGYGSIEIGSSQLLVNLGPNVNICGNGGSVVLDAGNPGMTYAWSGGQNTQQVTVTTVGTYTVTVTDNLGCNATDNITVGQVPGVSAAFNSPAIGTLFQPVQFTDQSAGAVTSWIWSFGDGITSTTQNPQHTYQGFGTYTVTLIVTDANNCRDTITQVIEISNFIGVEEEDFAKSLQLWPNPSSGIFHLMVEFAKPKAFEMEVTDLSGKRLVFVQENATQFVEKDIDLSGMAQGVYILRLQAGENQLFHKLIVQ